jgi:hypothetical protein
LTVGNLLVRRNYSAKESYETLGISPATFWKYVRLGKIKVVRLGARTTVTASELNRISEEGIPTTSGRGKGGRPPKLSGSAKTNPQN